MLEKKIRRLNKLAIEIDRWCYAIHPSGWDEVNKNKIAEYKQLAKEIGAA